MITRELPYQGDPARIEAALRAHGLEPGPRRTLKQHPGSVHWHARRAGEAGTLEVTLWPAGHRLWLSAHENRAAPWVLNFLDSGIDFLKVVV